MYPPVGKKELRRRFIKADDDVLSGQAQKLFSPKHTSIWDSLLSLQSQNSDFDRLNYNLKIFIPVLVLLWDYDGL